jgi:hypothetical protein
MSFTLVIVALSAVTLINEPFLVRCMFLVGTFSHILLLPLVGACSPPTIQFAGTTAPNQQLFSHCSCNLKFIAGFALQNAPPWRRVWRD